MQSITLSKRNFFLRKENVRLTVCPVVIVSVDVNVSAVSVVNFFVDIDVNLIVVLVGVIDVVADVDVD